MANCYCNLLKNLFARLIYTVISVVMIIIVAVLMADSMLTTFSFQAQVYAKETTKMTIKTISAEQKVESFYFKIGMPGKIWKVETATDTCMTYQKSDATPLKVGQSIDFYKTLNQAYIPSIGNFTCMDKESFDQQKGQFYYQKYNLMMAIILSIFIITFVIFLVLMWLCCSGWCGCECCGLCRICCDDKKTRETMRQQSLI